jgi:hypothetical protein
MRVHDPDPFVFWCVVVLGAIAAIPAILAWL